MKERTIILDGLSKTYAMPGWRIGYGVGNEQIIRMINKLMINSNSCTNAFAQMATLSAVRGDQEVVDMMCDQYAERSRYMVKSLEQRAGSQLQDAGRGLLSVPQDSRIRAEEQRVCRPPAVGSRSSRIVRNGFRRLRRRTYPLFKWPPLLRIYKKASNRFAVFAASLPKPLIRLYCAVLKQGRDCFRCRGSGGMLLNWTFGRRPYVGNTYCKVKGVEPTPPQPAVGARWSCV